jgi:hypothetical protein
MGEGAEGDYLRAKGGVATMSLLLVLGLLWVLNLSLSRSVSFNLFKYVSKSLCAASK